MFYLFLIAAISVLYYYRRFVFLKVLALVLWVCKMRIESRLNRMKKSFDKMIRVKNTNGFAEYKVTLSDKEYNIVFFSEVDVLDFKTSITDNINKRNLIVHSSITDDKGEIIYDITDYMRRFCFYFDKNVKLNRFFEFLKVEMQQMPNTELTKYNLMLYMNDDLFTEKIYSIKTIYNTDFKSIFLDSEDKSMPIMEDLD